MNLSEKEKKERLYTLLWGMASVIFVTLAAVIYLDIPNRDINVFFIGNGGDGCLISAAIKSMKEDGIIGQFFCDRTGAPDISSWIDAPFFDIFHTVQLWLCAVICPTVDCAAYVDFILTYTLAGVTSFIMFNKLKIKDWYNFVFTAIFVLSPTHYIRGIGHITVSHYFTVPLSVIIGLYIMDENASLTKKGKVLMIIAAVLVGLGYQYYAFFGAIIWVPAYFVFLVKNIAKENRDKKAYIKRLWPFAVTCFTLLLTRLPAMIYSHMYGKNTEVVARQALESEIYGLKIIQLFIPSPYNRNGFLQHIREVYSRGFNINENSFASLGLIAAFGLVMLVLWFFTAFVHRRKEFSVPDYLAFAAITMVLVCTTGGIGTMFNYIVTPQLRCYNRGSIVIGCLSLCFMAIFVNRIDLGKKSHNIAATVIICGFFMGVCWYDQIPPVLKQNEQEILLDKMYKDYFNKIEDAAPDGAMIYQLPCVPFPENPPVGNMADYTHLKAYIYTDDLKWSYGGIRGRNTAAQELYCDDGMSDAFVKNITEAGFSGVYIDLNGYQNRADEVKSFYDSFGITPIVSDDGMLCYYDISGIEISENHLRTGYSFTKHYALAIGYDASDDELSALIDLLETDGNSAAEVMYSWAEASGAVNLPNDEYVTLMAQFVLGRPLATAADQGWIGAVNDGLSKHDLLLTFVISQESYNYSGIQLRTEDYDMAA